MAEASKLGVMASENLSLYKENYEGKQRNSVCDEIMKIKSDSFTVDMEPFSHLTSKDLSFNSRINLQRNLSRKGSQIGGEKMMNNPSNEKDRDVTPSPKATGTMSDKSMLVMVGTTEHVTSAHGHHQITIVTGGAATTTTNSGGTPTKSRLIGKRSSSFKQSTIINPRRILFFFATLSSMGTILLIYFTLSIAKYNGDDNALDQ